MNRLNSIRFFHAALPKPPVPMRPSDTQAYHKPPRVASTPEELPGKNICWPGAALLFGGNRKLASTPSAHNNYITYTSDNTPCPLATWRAIANSEAVEYHAENAQVLQDFIQATGKYFQDYDWIKYRKEVGKVPYSVFDTETTGLNPKDRIVQIAVTQIAPEHHIDHTLDFNTHVNPGTDEQGNPFEIAPEATDVHGIAAHHVKDKPTIEALLLNLCNERLKKNGLAVAYNAKFDIHYLNNAIDKWNRSSLRREHGPLRALQPALVLDPYILIQRIHPFVSLRKRLGDHYEILMGHPLENKHDAQADVEATVDILKYVFKYMEKHTIPVQWAQFAAKNLPRKSWEPAEKAAIIARFVREHRTALETSLPAKPEPLKMTDILKFQHGAPVYYDESGLPKLDISLNIFGWDGTKVWADKNDRLDADIVRQIRQERDQENRQFLLEQFRAPLSIPAWTRMEILLQSFQPISSSGLKRNKANLQQASSLQKMLYKPGLTFVDTFLAKNLPQSEKGWQTLRKELEQEMKSYLNSQFAAVSKKPEQKNRVKQAHQEIKPLARELITRMQAIRDEMENRFFYREVPIDPQKPLIDPNVLAQKTSTRRNGRG